MVMDDYCCLILCGQINNFALLSINHIVIYNIVYNARGVIESICVQMR